MEYLFRFGKIIQSLALYPPHGQNPSMIRDIGREHPYQVIQNLVKFNFKNVLY